MNRRQLKKLNGALTAEDVEKNIANAGFVPFEEGNIDGLTLMTVFKGRERHCRRKKHDGVYTYIQSYTGAEGAEDCDFLALSAFEKTKARQEDGKKRRYLYCRLFVKKLK